MSVPEPFPMPASPTIPLTDDVRKAYQVLLNIIETTIEGTTDVATLQALNAHQGEIDDVLTKDNMYRLQASTALFDALQKQIKDTNDGLKKLQAQIESIASGFENAGEILAAVSSVLTLIPGV